MIYVYKIMYDGKGYIGASHQPRERFKSFKRERYNFAPGATLTILSEHRTRAEAYAAETAAIAFHNTLWPNGFNRTSSGQSKGRVRDHLTPGQIAKMIARYWASRGPFTKPTKIDAYASVAAVGWKQKNTRARK